MLSSNAPDKIELPFANTGDKRDIPIPSQISITPGAASFTDGFPPKTMEPLAEGGIPPDGLDFNGLFYDITKIQQWQSAGGMFKYDAAFAASISGYPKGARIISDDTTDVFVNGTEGNSTNPNTGGAGWLSTNQALQDAVDDATAQAGIATTQATLSAASAALSNSAKVAAEAARDAAIAGAADTWPTTAAGIGSGLANYTSLVAGSGGTNGTFALAYSGGTQVLAPVGVFTVAGGALVSITITYKGYYSAGTPTLSFAASSGLTGASATAVMAANTPVNGYFAIPSAVTGEAAIIYRNEAGVAVEKWRTATSAAVLAYDVFPGKAAAVANELAAMARVKKIQMFGADPAKYYSLKFLFWKDVGDRFNMTITQHTDSSGTGAVDVCVFSVGSGTTSYGGTVREITLAAAGGSGITATATLDFMDTTALTVNNASSSAAMFQRRAFAPRTIATSAARATDINDRITAALNANAALTGGLKIPFADGVSNDFIRKLVKDVYVYGANPAHTYIISQLEITTTRVTFILYDLTAAKVVCKTAYTAAIPDYNALQAVWKLDQGALAGVDWDGMYAVMTFDWAQAITGTYNYTTAAQSAIHPSKIFTNDLINDYLDRDFWHETIKVGPGETYTDLPAAFLSLYAIGANRKCHRAHFHHRILLQLAEGTFHSTFRNRPDWVDIRGEGVDRTYIIKENDTSDASIESHGAGKVFNLTMLNDSTSGSGQYCLHSDDANGISVQNGLVAQRIMQSHKGLRLVGGPTHDAALFGCGISSGEVIVFEDVEASHEKPNATAASFFFHNVGPTISVPLAKPSLKPSKVIMRGCRSRDNHLQPVYLQSLEFGPLCTLELHDSEFNCIYETIASSNEVIVDLAKDRFGWRVSGVHSGPLVRVDSDGSIVLRTTPGQAVTGTSAALIFGSVDELGRGDKWVLNGTVKSLGARLGDCSSVNKTLIIGGQTCTFNTDLTASTNTAVLAIINAAITVNPVTEVDIQKETYHDTGFTRRMLNSTGSTIPKGRAVTRAGTNTIALAVPGDDIFGWVFRDILNGLAGDVVITKKVHNGYITGASSNGKFGISSVTAGLIDYAAPVKVGYVIGGIVNFY